MADLKELLVISNLNETEIPDRFKKIAKDLMCNYIIKKGEKEYAIIEIEFYLYSPSHRDYITYPREIEAGRWFFHQSGVDLSFKSFNVKDIKEVENEKQRFSEATFGGILIRGIYNLDNSIKEDERYIFGPQNCVNELWDNFDAFNPIHNGYPILTALKESLINNLLQCKRHIKIDEKEKIIKVQSWIKRIGMKMEGDKTLNALFTFTKSRNYRFFNIPNNDNPCEFTKIPSNARPKENEIIKIG